MASHNLCQLENQKEVKHRAKTCKILAQLQKVDPPPQNLRQPFGGPVWPIRVCIPAPPFIMSQKHNLIGLTRFWKGLRTGCRKRGRCACGRKRDRNTQRGLKIHRKNMEIIVPYFETICPKDKRELDSKCSWM